MLKIDRILCPMDFSEFSVRAYDYAQSLAKHYRARLYVEHVVPPLTTTYPYYPFPEAVNDALLERIRAGRRTASGVGKESHPERDPTRIRG